MFEDLKVEKNEPLEAAHERLMRELGLEGLPTYAPDLVNKKLRSGAFGRILNVFAENVNHVVYVCTTEWTPEVTLAVVNDLLIIRLSDMAALGGRPLFTFVSAFPVPDVVRYVFADTRAGHFEALCMRDLALVNPMPTETAATVGEKVAIAVDKAFEIKIAWGDLNEAGKIDAIVLEQMRPVRDATAALPEGQFQPQYGLIGLGCLLGEILRRHAQVEGKWVANPQSVLGLGLQMRLKGRAASAIANPVDKLLKLYINGRKDSALEFTKMLLAHLSK